jgi:hypothetical protein
MVDTHDPPYEQVLIDVGGGYHVVKLGPQPADDDEIRARGYR